MSTKNLTAKQARFIEEYMVDLNATQAAIRAGYSEKGATSRGSQLLANVNVAAEVTERQKAISEKLEITRDDIARELYKLGFSNMEDYMYVGEDGFPRLDLSELTRDQAAAITELNVETYYEGKGDKAVPVKKAKVKIHDKRGALDTLAKLLGHNMAEKHEVTGADGGPIEYTEITRTIVHMKEGS